MGLALLKPVWLMLFNGKRQPCSQTSWSSCQKWRSEPQPIADFLAFCATTRNFAGSHQKKKTEGLRGIPHCWCLHHHIGKCTCKNTMRFSKAVADHKKHANSFVLRQIENSHGFFFKQRTQLSTIRGHILVISSWNDVTNQTETLTCSFDRPLGGTVPVWK